MAFAFSNASNERLMAAVDLIFIFSGLREDFGSDRGFFKELSGAGSEIKIQLLKDFAQILLEFAQGFLRFAKFLPVGKPQVMPSSSNVALTGLPEPLARQASILNEPTEGFRAGCLNINWMSSRFGHDCGIRNRFGQLLRRDGIGLHCCFD